MHPQAERAPRASNSPFLKEIRDIWTLGVDNLVVIASFSLCFEGDD